MVDSFASMLVVNLHTKNFTIIATQKLDAEPFASNSRDFNANEVTHLNGRIAT